MFSARFTRSRLSPLLCLFLLAPPAFALDAQNVPDGHDWLFYSPQTKLQLIRESIAAARAQGIMLQFSPLLYYVRLDDYYSDWDQLDANLGNAMFDLSLWLGDFQGARQFDGSRTSDGDTEPPVQP